jgi:phosphatidylglycerol:prolipoprotein diacylglycerol transferase
MLPFVHVSDLEVFGIHLHPFGFLVAAAVLVGCALVRWRARKRGFDLQKLESFIAWMLFAGFASAHVLDEVLYRPRDVLARPWSLLYVWEGIGSFSGFLGALAGVVLWRHFEARGWKLVRRPKPLPILPFADLILSVFPLAWIFGRAGCSIAHDHPGARAAEGTLLAIAFPSPNPAAIDGPGRKAMLGPITVIHGAFPRYDLGTIELFVTLGIAVVCIVLWRRRRATGTYAVVVSLVYAPIRFALDFLRLETSDVRYGGLTPAQWMCVALFLFGIALLRYVVRLKRQGSDPSEALLAPRSMTS